MCREGCYAKRLRFSGFLRALALLGRLKLIAAHAYLSVISQRTRIIVAMMGRKIQQKYSWISLPTENCISIYLSEGCTAVLQSIITKNTRRVFI